MALISVLTVFDFSPLHLSVPSFENRQDAPSRGYRPVQSRILAGLLIPKRTLQSEF